ITQRKQAAEERHRLTQALANSEARYHSVLDNAADAVFISDRNGRYLYANRQAGRLLGCTTEHLLSLSISDITPEEEAHRSADALAELLTMGQFTTELLLKRMDGS